MVGGIIGDLLHVSGPQNTLWLLQTLRANAMMTIKKLKKQGGKSVKKVLERVKHGNKAS
jgi:hypothetical protein